MNDTSVPGSWQLVNSRSVDGAKFWNWYGDGFTGFDTNGRTTDPVQLNAPFGSSSEIAVPF